MTDSAKRAPSDNTDGSDISGDVRGMQVITAALIMGVLMFLGVAVAMNEGRFGTEPGFMFWFGLGFACLIFVVHVVVPAVMRRQQMSQLNAEEFRSSDAGVHMRRLLPIYKGTHIIACALLEGAAFLNLVCYQVEGFVGSIGIALLMVASIAVRFPSNLRIRSWVTTATEELALK